MDERLAEYVTGLDKKILGFVENGFNKFTDAFKKDAKPVRDFNKFCDIFKLDRDMFGWDMNENTVLYKSPTCGTHSFAEDGFAEKVSKDGPVHLGGSLISMTQSGDVIFNEKATNKFMKKLDNPGMSQYIMHEFGLMASEVYKQTPEYQAYRDKQMEAVDINMKAVDFELKDISDDQMAM